jgi:CRP-like cAMP-binding protein
LLILAYPGQLIYDPDASRETPLVVTALSDCEAFRIEGRALEEAARKDAEVSALLLRALHAEIRRRTAILAEFLTLSPAERLQRRCAEFAAVLGSGLQPGRLPIGHQDLAMVLELSGRQLRRIQAQVSLSKLNPRRSSATHR